MKINFLIVTLCILILCIIIKSITDKKTEHFATGCPDGWTEFTGVNAKACWRDGKGAGRYANDSRYRCRLDGYTGSYSWSKCAQSQPTTQSPPAPAQPKFQYIKDTTFSSADNSTLTITLNMDNIENISSNDIVAVLSQTEATNWTDGKWDTIKGTALYTYVCNPPVSEPTMYQCAGNYGDNVGSAVCCGQSGEIGNSNAICSEDRPQCVDYKQGKRMGRCINNLTGEGKACAAHFGSKQGDPVCCNQDGDLGNPGPDGNTFACSIGAPICVGFKQGKKMGSCAISVDTDNEKIISSYSGCTTAVREEIKFTNLTITPYSVFYLRNINQFNYYNNDTNEIDGQEVRISTEQAPCPVCPTLPPSLTPTPTPTPSTSPLKDAIWSSQVETFKNRKRSKKTPIRNVLWKEGFVGNSLLNIDLYTLSKKIHPGDVVAVLSQKAIDLWDGKWDNLKDSNGRIPTDNVKYTYICDPKDTTNTNSSIITKFADCDNTSRDTIVFSDLKFNPKKVFYLLSSKSFNFTDSNNKQVGFSLSVPENPFPTTPTPEEEVEEEVEEEIKAEAEEEAEAEAEEEVETEEEEGVSIPAKLVITEEGDTIPGEECLPILSQKDRDTIIQYSTSLPAVSTAGSYLKPKQIYCTTSNGTTIPITDYVKFMGMENTNILKEYKKYGCKLGSEYPSKISTIRNTKVDPEAETPVQKGIQADKLYKCKNRVSNTTTTYGIPSQGSDFWSKFIQFLKDLWQIIVDLFNSPYSINEETLKPSGDITKPDTASNTDTDEYSRLQTQCKDPNNLPITIKQVNDARNNVKRSPDPSFQDSGYISSQGTKLSKKTYYDYYYGNKKNSANSQNASDWTYVPDYQWTVPQKRAPTCVGNNNKKKVSGYTENYDSIFKKTSVGSMLPDFSYTQKSK